MEDTELPEAAEADLSYLSQAFAIMGADHPDPQLWRVKGAIGMDQLEYGGVDPEELTGWLLALTELTPEYYGRVLQDSRSEHD